MWSKLPYKCEEEKRKLVWLVSVLALQLSAIFKPFILQACIFICNQPAICEWMALMHWLFVFTSAVGVYVSLDSLVWFHFSDLVTKQKRSLFWEDLTSSKMLMAWIKGITIINKEVIGSRTSRLQFLATLFCPFKFPLKTFSSVEHACEKTDLVLKQKTRENVSKPTYSCSAFIVNLSPFHNS